MRRVATCAFVASVLFLLPPAVLVVLPPATAWAGTYYMQVCPYYGNAGGPFTWWSDAGNLHNPTCGIQQGGGVLQGKGAHWIVSSPSSAIAITGVYTPPYQVTVDCNASQDGFASQYFWAGGAKSIDYLSGFGCNQQGYGYGTGINQAIGPSNYFGWGITCSTASVCLASSFGHLLTVDGVQLQLTENTGPGILPIGSNNLWFQNGHWVPGGRLAGELRCG